MSHPHEFEFIFADFNADQIISFCCLTNRYHHVYDHMLPIDKKKFLRLLSFSSMKAMKHSLMC